MRHVGEARVVPLEGDGHRLGRPVAVLGDDDVGLTDAVGLVLVVVVVAVDEDDYVRVLLQRAGLSQVGHRGALVVALLRVSVQLRDRDHRQLQFLGEQLHLPGELGHLQLAGLDLLTGAHQLQVVENDQLEVVLLLEPAGLGADLHHRQVGGVVHVQRGRPDQAGLAGHPVPLVAGHGALTHVGQRHRRLRREHAHGDLGLAHLEGEDARGQPVLDRRGPTDVQPQGRLAHTRPCGNDHHLP
ncbi:hypothetical protein SDC9_83083 [bioreactor metagenome]|uniref:NAD-specific glutamate dehydrogenase n=1 Tax=bioreactor metagenome TaxID=1076179 RepID=A0A644Z6H4_9ZZZZ